jgi:hypothetical protein
MLLCALVLAQSAQATFPGHDGKFVFEGNYTANPDGSGGFQVTTPPPGGDDFDPKWSPDGQRIAFARYAGSPTNAFDIYLVNADGTGLVNVTQSGSISDPRHPAWSPDGSQLAFDACAPGCWGVYVINVDGSGLHELAGPASTADVRYVAPKWSPDGQKIAFLGWTWNGVDNLPYDIYTINADGTGLTDITNTPSFDERSFDWSPDGSRIVFEGGTSPSESDIYVMNRDGSGRVDIAPDPSAYEDNALWSPDGARILFFSPQSPAGYYLMNPDGSSRSPFSGTNISVKDWQPIPINSYPPPRGATPLRLSLVPAYRECTSPNDTHGAPLSSGSCAPPQLTSSQLTVGTPDSNGKRTTMEAYIQLTTIVGTSTTPADVQITTALEDVFNKDLSDYTGQLRAELPVRITDKNNAPSPGGPGAATTVPFPFGFDIPCTATPADATVGSDCTITTTVNTLYPGAIVAGKRAIWQMGRGRIDDSGPDGNPDTTADNTVFLDQGVFVP